MSDENECGAKVALNDLLGGSLVDNLRKAVVTMHNDDTSEPGSQMRERFMERRDAMIRAIYVLENVREACARECESVSADHGECPELAMLCAEAIRSAT